MAFLRAGSDRISGKLGGRVYRDAGGGDVVVAAAPQGRDARSPAQLAQRARLERVNDLWASLPLEKIARWRRYAEALPAPPKEGKGRRTSGDAEFRRLATKYLAVHGGRDAPSEPPTGAFLGDGPTVRAMGGGEEPAVLFAADFPNTPGVLTELLVQRLPARHCLPKARDYRTAAYVAFAGEPVAVPCRRGAYACAVRFVRAATGQATAMVPIGMVEVGQA